MEIDVISDSECLRPEKLPAFLCKFEARKNLDKVAACSKCLVSPSDSKLYRSDCGFCCQKSVPFTWWPGVVQQKQIKAFRGCGLYLQSSVLETSSLENANNWVPFIGALYLQIMFDFSLGFVVVVHWVFWGMHLSLGWPIHWTISGMVWFQLCNSFAIRRLKLCGNQQKTTGDARKYRRVL